MGTENNHSGAFSAEEQAFIQAQADYIQQQATNKGIDGQQYTDEERLIISAFSAALDEFGKDPDMETARRKIRELCGVKERSPFDLLIIGFIMGFDKGAGIANTLLDLMGK